MLAQILLLAASMVRAVFSLEYPVGLDASLCPNYPFCNDFPPVSVLQYFPRRYPANVEPSSCPNYPYCNQDVIRQEPTKPLPASAYPADVDPSLCPNYPFCNTISYAPVPADVDPRTCPNYPFC